MALYEIKDGVGIIPEGTTKIENGAFLNCTELTSVDIPNSVTEIGQNAFSGCSSLESLFIPASVTEIGSDCFEDCYSLSSIVVDENNKVFDSRNNCNAIIQTREKSLILGCKNTVIPNSIMSIGGGAFSGCKELKEISMPDTVGLIIGYAFKNCTGLSSVNLGKSLKEICSSAFYGCTSLTHIIIPKSVQKIQQTNGYAYIPFYYCKNLKSIVVEDGNRFYDSRDNCNAIIVSTNTDLSKDTLIVLCSSTIVPATVTRISISAIECPKNLTSISVAEGNTCYDSRDNSKAIIETETNVLLIGTASTIIPETVTGIGEYAFWGNDFLEEFTIPQSVTKIGNNSFRECKNLKAVSILGPVALIEKDTFKDCTALETLTFGTGIKKINPNAFDTCTAIKTIYVPAKKGDYYRQRLPETLHEFIVEQEPMKKAKK